MKNKKNKMGMTMWFNYGLLALALIFILFTKKDEKSTDDCHVPTHHHEHLENEMEALNKDNKTEAID